MARLLSDSHRTASATASSFCLTSVEEYRRAIWITLSRFSVCETNSAAQVASNVPRTVPRIAISHASAVRERELMRYA